MYMALKNYISNITQTPGFQLNVYTHFASASLCSRYGCWGLIESSNANLYLSPKYMAYHDAINSAQTCSWDERANTCPGNNTCQKEAFAEKALPSQHKTIDAIATSAMSLTRMVLVKLNILKVTSARMNVVVAEIALSIIMTDFILSLLVTA
jgi:hypothetical protein